MNSFTLFGGLLICGGMFSMLLYLCDCSDVRNAKDMDETRRTQALRRLKVFYTVISAIQFIFGIGLFYLNWQCR